MVDGSLVYRNLLLWFSQQTMISMMNDPHFSCLQAQNDTELYGFFLDGYAEWGIQSHYLQI